MYQFAEFEDLSLVALMKKIKNWIEDFDMGNDTFQVQDIVIHYDNERFWVGKIWYWITSI